MKRIINKVTYSCEFCGENFATPKEASIHENTCTSRPDLEERLKELEERNNRKKLIEKFYQSENIKELNENWIKYMKTYHKIIDSTKVKVILDREKMGKIEYTYLIKIQFLSNIYNFNLNHQVNTEIKNFPKILEKIKELEQAEKDYSINHSAQVEKVAEKENELRLSDEEYQNNLKKYNSIFKEIENLQRQAKELRIILDSSAEKKYLEAKKIIDFVDYKEKIKNLQNDLGIK